MGVDGGNTYMSQFRAITCVCAIVHNPCHVLDKLFHRFPIKKSVGEMVLWFGRYVCFHFLCVQMRNSVVLIRGILMGAS